MQAANIHEGIAICLEKFFADTAAPHRRIILCAQMEKPIRPFILIEQVDGGQDRMNDRQLAPARREVRANETNAVAERRNIQRGLAEVVMADDWWIIVFRREPSRQAKQLPARLMRHYYEADRNAHEQLPPPKCKAKY